MTLGKNAKTVVFQDERKTKHGVMSMMQSEMKLLYPARNPGKFIPPLETLKTREQDDARYTNVRSDTPMVSAFEQDVDGRSLLEFHLPDLADIKEKLAVYRDNEAFGEELAQRGLDAKLAGSDPRRDASETIALDSEPVARMTVWYEPSAAEVQARELQDPSGDVEIVQPDQIEKTVVSMPVFDDDAQQKHRHSILANDPGEQIPDPDPKELRPASGTEKNSIQVV